MSRTAMRKMLGKKDADNEIEEFYEKIGETPPWEIEPETWRKPKQKLFVNGAEVKTGRKSRRGKSSRKKSDYDFDSDSDSDSLFVSQRSKGRQHTRKDNSSDDDSISDDSSSRKMRNSKAKKGKSRAEIDQHAHQDDFTKMMQQMMTQITETQKRQMEDITKMFEQTMRRTMVVA